MFRTIKERVSKLLDPQEKDPVSRVFRNPEYVQNESERSSRILFLKLLMMIAHVDGNVDAEELNLIKDYAYENCLNESEWREISSMEYRDVSKEEIEQMIDTTVKEVSSKTDKEEFVNAVQSIIDADGVTGKEERALLKEIREKIEKQDVSILSNLSRGIKKSLKKTRENVISLNGGSVTGDPSNPVAHLVQESGISNEQDARIIGAKLGIAILLIHTDLKIQNGERSSFQNLIRKEMNLNDGDAGELAERILQIPEENFELTRLGRILTESLGEKERQKFLEEMFRLARSDNNYELVEENYLRVISVSLMLSHRDFIQAKLSTES